MFADVVNGFVVLFLIFVPLERLMALAKQQKIFRRLWGLDAFYYFSGYFISRGAIAVCMVTALWLSGHTISSEFQAAIASQSLACQLLEAIVLADFGYYIAHRLLHTVPWLWEFHSIHHSVQEMDWLASVRVHPVDQFLAKFMQLLPLYLMGFSTETLAIFLIFAAAMGMFIHTNIRVKFGALKWVIATPEFHHWHHANEPRICDKNLAAQLPIYDLLFGTCYLPKNKRPSRFGVWYPVPSNYLHQCIYPFQQLFSKSQ